MARDVYDVRPETKKVNLNVRYTRAKTSRKIFAKIIDLLFFLLIGILFFVAARAIVQSSSYYQEVYNGLQEMMVSSGVYLKIDDQLVESSEYYNDSENYSSSEIMNNLEGVIKTFYDNAYSFTITDEMSLESYEEMVEIYDEYRLDITYSSVNLFVENEDGQIMKNPNFSAGSNTYTAYILSLIHI